MITPARPSDFRLLQRFASDDDEAAFEELVHRHGGMTRGVCRRVLGPGGDADDAAQSAFLSLAKSASLLVDQLGTSGSLAGWLYRVAVNAALQQRRATKARRHREVAVVREREVRSDSVTETVEHAELLGVLDEELKELPARFRTPLVLCHLEGKTQHEAANELGLSYGTLRRRLDQGRQLLKARIGRRGVMASSTLLAILWKTASAEAAATPTRFTDSVVAALRAEPAAPVAVVRPRVSSPGRVPSPAVRPAGSYPASVYSALLAALLFAMAIPPVVASVTSEANSTSSAEANPPSVKTPSSSMESLSRSAV